ncbi:MAG: anti-sigma regulatory factor, partial [Ruthenibacterium sp.]
MMEPIVLHYIVPGDDFTRAGEASADLKARLKKLGLPSDAIRKVAIALYEG